MDKPDRIVTSNSLSPFILLYHTVLAAHKGKKGVSTHDVVVASVEDIIGTPALTLTAHGESNKRKVWIFHSEHSKKDVLRKESYSIIYGEEGQSYLDFQLKRKSGYHYPMDVVLVAISYLNTGIIKEIDAPQ